MSIEIPEDLKQDYKLIVDSLKTEERVTSPLIDTAENRRTLGQMKYYIERIASLESLLKERERELEQAKTALNRVWEVASGESQVAMDDTAGMEYLSDYVSTVWAELHEGKELAAIPEPTSEINNLRAENADLKAERDALQSRLDAMGKAAVESEKKLGDLRQLLLKNASPHAYGSHVSPDVESCHLNEAKEPEGERLRNELEAWLEKNEIVGILMDTRGHFIDIHVPRLPPCLKHVLTHWGAISVVDHRDEEFAARAKGRQELE